ncbi:hypothetical protein ACFQZQ_07405 [Lysobacter koreensis]|uniref:Uncharacterized protein n=1 Tax=Lysobacter koreensis TaxID=266122 RepID=A0ABW2YN77_9GAMM
MNQFHRVVAICGMLCLVVAANLAAARGQDGERAAEAEAAESVIVDDGVDAAEAAMMAAVAEAVAEAEREAAYAGVAIEAEPQRAPTDEQLRRVDAGSHYYLSGIREVGSELRLHPDGRFEWMLAYGAMNQSAKGRWHREGTQVVLVADMPKPDATLFSLVGSSEWDERAEAELLAARDERKRGAVLARCPFVAKEDYASSPDAFGDPPPSYRALADAARRSVQELEATSKALEVAASAAMAPGSASPEAALETAKSAMDAYQVALIEARNAHANAGLELPLRPEPVLPATCQLPKEEAIPSAPSQWQRGIAVRVGDPQADALYGGINVSVRYSDGQTSLATTNQDGWAVFERRPGVRPVALTLSVEESQFPPENLALPSGLKELIQIRLDSQAATPTAFESMSLRVDGDDLVPTWPEGERGRYSRD